MPDSVELRGPWRHRYVAANGARFHVVESGTDRGAPLVLLLHGFPEFWWAWRAQLPALAAAGYRAAAMDLRGYGGSDKTPRGYDPLTLAGDVAGVVGALGERSVVLVGHGWGGYVAWTVATAHRTEVMAVCAVSAPHPRTMLRRFPRVSPRIAGHLLSMQVPMLPERRLANPRSGLLRAHLSSWAGPSAVFPDDETLATYANAMRLWPAPHCALEYHRWLLRSRLRNDGRRFAVTMADLVEVPACVVYGEEDRVIPAASMLASRRRVAGDFTSIAIPGCGHFPHEEQPTLFTDHLLGWLRVVAPLG